MMNLQVTRACFWMGVSYRDVTLSCQVVDLIRLHFGNDLDEASWVTQVTVVEGHAAIFVDLRKWCRSC